MRETSLEEFVGEDESANPDDDASNVENEGTNVKDDGGGLSGTDGGDHTRYDDGRTAGNDTGSDPEESIGPTATTYESTPDGVACADCGNVVEERWRDENEMVCAACKTW